MKSPRLKLVKSTETSQLERPCIAYVCAHQPYVVHEQRRS
jgi:hypothetical protein